MIGYKTRIHRFLAKSLARKNARRDPGTPIVSFTFDDFPRSALTVGGKMLLDRGWKGTFYGAMGLMGTTVEGKPMFTRGNLDTLLDDGHELACHTFSHSSCLSVSTEEFLNICGENRREAATLLTGYQLQNMSFPHGHITLPVKHRLRTEYRTCRTTEWGINSNFVDLSFLRANPMYSRFAIERLKRIVRTNYEVGGWLILYTHDVTRDPSPYGCTPEYFNEVLSCVFETRAEVLTIREAGSRYHL
jgi:peptidoglycan/xylan/chitin deacetylase (PgdA/CDA1 family)